VKTQKEKNVAVRTQILIKSNMVFVEDTPLIAALQPNVNELNKKSYKFINIIFTSNRTYDSLKVFREKVGKR
jgi:hypothetical protein